MLPDVNRPRVGTGEQLIDNEIMDEANLTKGEDSDGPAWRLEHAFNYEGDAVRYAVRGSGPPLVLVHGTPWSSFNWRHILDALSEWFTVYYYDLLGYGQSDKHDEQDVSLRVQGLILGRLIEHWEVDRPFIVGHDFGGTVVLRAHLLHGVDFRKLVLVDPVALAPWGSPFFQSVRSNAAVFAALPEDIHGAIVAAYVQSATHRPLQQATLKGILRPWLGPEGQPAFYRQIAQADQRFTDEIEGYYSTIRRPVLILWGQEDRWIPAQRGYELQKLIPNSRLRVLPGAGHLVQEDLPALLVAHVLRFLIKT